MSEDLLRRVSELHAEMNEHPSTFSEKSFSADQKNSVTYHQLCAGLSGDNALFVKSYEALRRLADLCKNHSCRSTVASTLESNMEKYYQAKHGHPDKLPPEKKPDNKIYVGVNFRNKQVYLNPANMKSL